MPWRPRNPQQDAATRQRAHSRQAARPSAQQRGYTSRWAVFSKHWLQTHPLCGEQQDGSLSPAYSRCVQAGRLTPAEVTDHILSMARGGAPYDPTNLQSLCRACNSAKMQRYERG